MENSKQKYSLLKIALGPFVFLLMEWIGKPETLGVEAYHVLCTTVWIAVWWILEAVPIAVTALLPIVLFPLTGAMEIDVTTQSIGLKYIFLYIGGFMIENAIERWGLHKRIALNIIYYVGSDVAKIILGFMMATAFLSMWISNTATSVMMLPIGMALVTQFKSTSGDSRLGEEFGKALMLSIAYSASIGGLATLVGTPPNLVLAGILKELYGYKITFVQWISFGLPISALLIFICWKYLTSFAFKFYRVQLPGGKEKIKQLREDLGRLSYEEKAVAIVFALTATCWMLRSFIEQLIPAVDDTMIAMFFSIVLFIVPANGGDRKIITWEEAVRLPWGIILLFGGGMTLAKGFSTTGLAVWIAERMSQMDGLSVFMLILVLVAMVNLLTEITSNLATTAMLLPVLAPMALSLNLHPLMIMTSVTIAASCAFMLPVATPPNAVVFGSGYLRIPDMVRSGVFMNVISIILITIATYLFLPYLWDIDPHHFPETFRTYLTD